MNVFAAELMQFGPKQWGETSPVVRVLLKSD
jgi:hypothetical protein